MHENDRAKIVLDCAFKIHRERGRDVLESGDMEIFSYAIAKKSLVCERQAAIPVVHQTIKLEIGFQADITVEHKVIIELKSIETVFTCS